jgi:hypothetical protein
MEEQETNNPSNQSVNEDSSDSITSQYNFFLHFSKPYSDAIDNGTFFQKPISWLYTLIGSFFLLMPLVIAAAAIDDNFSSYSLFYQLKNNGNPIVISFWAIFSLVCLIFFQIWINRKNKLLKLDGSKGFLATTIMANIISTTGECYGVAVGILGFFASLFSLFIDEMGYLTSQFSEFIPFGEIGLVGLILFPILGYTMVISFRFFSELIMGVAQIARNTAK